MASMKLEDFQQRVLSVCSDLKIVKSVAVFASSETSVLLRIVLIDSTFLDVYYNERTGKTSFAHIQNETRVFGADNVEGWHWHPREDPTGHVPAESEVSFEEFMAKLEADIK